MSEKEYTLTVDELALQIHRVLKDLYPSLEISGDDIWRFFVSKKRDIKFFAENFAIEFKIDAIELIEKIYMELMVEFEKNWHDRVFFKILKDNEKISFERIMQDRK